jgi:hypothetical protein
MSNSEMDLGKEILRMGMSSIIVTDPLPKCRCESSNLI